VPVPRKPAHNSDHANSGHVPGQMDVWEVLEDVEKHGLTPGEENDRPTTPAERKIDQGRPLTAAEVVAYRLKGKTE
jgi:hypothetical protein